MQPNRKRIVVAEDNEAVLELVTIRLELAGYHTIAARDGFQALERIRSTNPAALILDIGMPRLDGMSVLRELGRSAPRVPVLVLTARRSSQEVREVISLGAAAYLTKPFNDQLLIQRVARMVDPPQKEQELHFL